MAADFYIVPPRLIVGTFDRSNVVTSFNSLRGDITLVANASTGVKITSSGGKFTISIIDDFYIKKAGDYVTGNIVFTPSGTNYGLAVGSGPSDPGTGTTGSLFFNTTANTLRVYNGSAWGDIVSSGGISLATADARYLKLDGTNTPTGNISMGSVFLRFANLATQSLAGTAGQVYFNTTTKVLDVYDGTKWQPAGQGITSLTPGTGISLSTNPITSYGSVSVDQSYNFTWTGSHTFTNAITFAPAQTFDISKLIASGQQTGDLIFYNGANWARVGIGTTGQVLTVGSSGTAISWINPTGGGGPITSGILAAIYGGTGYSYYNLGDLLVGAGNTFIRLPRGTDHYVLSSSDTSATGLTWRTASALASTSLSPVGSYPGDFWFDSTDGSFSIWYDDGTSTQWVQIASAFSGEVYTSNQYTIPYYVSSIGLTGSNYFTNIGTGISILYTTSSTSTSTGALVVSGGVGIGGSLNVGNSLSLGQALLGKFGGTGYTTYTKGDLLVGAGDTFIKFPIGTNSYVLASDSTSATGVSWVRSSFGGTVATPSAANLVAYYPGTGASVASYDRVGINNAFASMQVTSQNSLPGFILTATNGSVANAAEFQSALGTVYWAFSNTSQILSATNGGALNLTDGTGLVSITAPGGLYFYDSTNTYYTGFEGAGTANTVYTLPARSPATGTSVLQSTPSGILSWVPMVATTASIATTSLNVNTVQAFSGANHSLILSPSTSGSGVALSSSPTVTFNPSTFIMNVSGLAITSGTASTNTSTGALTVNGGVGISGQLSFARASFGYTGINFNPTMSFIGNTTSSPLTFTVLTDNSLSWEGTSGQLFSIDNNLTTGEIFSVSDISGLPIISASAGQTVSLNEFGGYTRIGNGSINAIGITNASLVVYGGIGITGNAFIGGTLNISNPSTSISSSSGAFTVAGGVGIGGSLYVASATAISGVTINNGIITGTLVGSATSSGFATTANYANQAGYATTSGTAVTSYSAFINAASTSSSHSLIFSPISGSSSGAGLSINSVLNFNPSSNILYSSGLAITASTVSSSVSTGALTVNGGVGISGRLSFNQAALGTTGISINPTMALIGNTGDPIYMSVLEDNTLSFEGSQGQLFSITPNLSTGYIYSVNDITGIPLLRANANANVTANEFAGNFGIGLSNPAYKLHVIGSIGFTSNINSTSTSTGTLVVGGGVGIAGTANIGSNAFIGGNLSVTGNLTVNGTTTTIESTVSTLADPIFVLGAAAGGTQPYIDDNKDRGIEFRYFSGTGKTGFFGFQDSTGKFTFIPDGTNSGEVFSGAAGTAVFGSVEATTFLGTFTGTATTARNIHIANAGNFNSSHSILFTSNATTSGSAVSSDSTFVFNPSTEILSLSGLAVTSSVASTSTSTGALIVTGGVGIGNSLFVNGRVDAANYKAWVENRTLSSVDTCVGIGTFFINNGANNLLLSLNVSDGGYSVAKNYSLTSDYVSSGWYIVAPISSTGAYNNNASINFQLEAIGSGNNLTLRARSLGTGGNLKIYIQNVGQNTATFSTYNSVTSESALTSYFPSAFVSQEKYLFKVNSSTASTTTGTGALVVTGGVGIGGSLYVSSASNISNVILNNGVITGTLSGYATTSNNVRIASAGSSNLAHPVLFTPSSSTSGSAISSDNTFSFNSSTEILSVSGLAVTAATASTSGFTGALTVAGGVGIGGTAYIAGDETVLGRLYYTQSTVGVAGTSTISSIQFVGQDNNPITLSVLTDNTLSFEGSSGQLFSINNNLSSGTIFSVNDISGIPILRANANGTLSMGEFSGNVGIGLSLPSYKLHIAGDTNLSSGYVYRINGTSVLSSSTLGTGVTNSSLTSVGTITSGTWAGTLITALYGGTGYSTYTKGDILVGSGTSFIRVGSGTSNFVLSSHSMYPAGVGWTWVTAVGVGTNPPSNYHESDLWWNANDGSLNLYYNDGDTSQWVEVVGGNGIDLTQPLHLYSNVNSVSTNTGALIVDGGAGIAGNVFIGGSVSIAGIVTSGTWAGTAITARYGGTGYSSYTKGDLLVGAGGTFILVGAGASHQVLNPTTSTSSGVGWTDLSLSSPISTCFGSFYSSSTQTVLGADIATPITVNNVYAAANMGIMGGSGTSSRIQLYATGVYNIQFSLQFNLSLGTQPKLADIWFRIDGTDVPWSNSRQNILGKDFQNILSLNFVSSFNAGSYFEMMMSSSDANFILETTTGITLPTRPDIPSVILTVTKVL